MQRRTALNRLLAAVTLGFGPVRQACAEVATIKARQLSDEGGPAGLVWKVTGGVVPHFLAGTLHALRRQDHPIPPAYDEAYRQCRQVYFETSPLDGLNPNQRKAFFDQALFEGGRSLRTELPAASWRKMMAFLDRYRLPAGDLSKAKPWYAAIRLRDHALEKAGFRKNLGLEYIYFNKARTTGRPVGGLSTFEDQVARSSATDDFQQLRTLIQLIDHLGGVGAEAAAVVEAWQTGTISDLDRMIVPTEDINASNSLWARRIHRLVRNSPSPTLFLIGAAHFAGPKGIQRLIS